MTDMGNNPVRETCGECGQPAFGPAVIAHTSKIRYEGSLHTVSVSDLPVFKCDACGSISMGSAAQSRLHDALCEQLLRLPPSRVRANRIALGTQRAVADDLGLAMETVSRWESGLMLQTRGYDRWMRAYFALPVLRRFLANLNHNPHLGEHVVWEDAADSKWNEQPIKAAPVACAQSQAITVADATSGLNVLEAANSNYALAA
jgi:hypothetical protein